MEHYRRSLRTRLILLCLVALLVATLAILGAQGASRVEENESLAGFILGFQISIFLALQGVVLYQLLRTSKALNNRELLRQMYVLENDERRRLIQDKIGGLGFNLSLGAIGLATVIAGYYDQTAFFTLLGALGLSVLIKATLKVYYRIKY